MCLPAPEYSFDYNNSRNDPQQIEIRLAELDALRRGRNRALMHQMKCVPTRTPYVQVPKTQPVPEVVKNAEVTRRTTRLMAASAKKRGLDDTEEDKEGAKRRKCNTVTRGANTGKPSSEVVESKDITDQKGGKELVSGKEPAQEAKQTSKGPQGEKKRATTKKAKKTATTIERALTREEAKHLALQNPRKQFVFDLDDKPQD